MLEDENAGRGRSAMLLANDGRGRVYDVEETSAARLSSTTTTGYGRPFREHEEATR